MVPLSPKLVQVLACLAEGRGELVSRDLLLDRFWPDVTVSDNTLTRAIADIRHALDDAAGTPAYIQTLARRGYRFVAPVAEETAPPDRAQPGDRRRLERGRRPRAIRGLGTGPGDARVAERHGVAGRRRGVQPRRGRRPALRPGPRRTGQRPHLPLRGDARRQRARRRGADRRRRRRDPRDRARPDAGRGVGGAGTRAGRRRPGRGIAGRAAPGGRARAAQLAPPLPHRRLHLGRGAPARGRARRRAAARLPRHADAGGDGADRPAVARVRSRRGGPRRRRAGGAGPTRPPTPRAGCCGCAG